MKQFFPLPNFTQMQAHFFVERFFFCLPVYPMLIMGERIIVLINLYLIIILCLRLLLQIVQMVQITKKTAFILCAPRLETQAQTEAYPPRDLHRSRGQNPPRDLGV